MIQSLILHMRIQCFISVVNTKIKLKMFFILQIKTTEYLVTYDKFLKGVFKVMAP